MPIQDFYKGETKKFNVAITYNGSAPNITSDTVIFYLKDNISDTTYALTSSADVSSSGSTGIAKFTLTDEETTLLNDEIYNYEICWNISGSGEEYVLEQNSFRIKERIL